MDDMRNELRKFCKFRRDPTGTNSICNINECDNCIWHLNERGVLEVQRARNMILKYRGLTKCEDGLRRLIIGRRKT